MENIGLIGAGVMGITVARRLLDAGYLLKAFDPAPAAVARIRALGAAIAESPASASADAEAVLMLLPGPTQVEQCVAGSEGILDGARPGTIVVDLSTVGPDTTRRMAQLAGEKGIGYLDAPVLGRPATVGQWALPVGGPIEELDRCRPLLESFAKNIIHIGESGSGHKVKLLNQLMFGAINAMTAEMMAVAAKVGVAPSLLYETITASQAGTVSNLFKELGRRISQDDYNEPTFTVDLLVKDVKLGVQMACDHGAPPVLGKTIDLIDEIAQAQGQGACDTSIMWKTLLNIWK
mgnify:CR=1 FL=1